MKNLLTVLVITILFATFGAESTSAQRTRKPVLKKAKAIKKPVKKEEPLESPNSRNEQSKDVKILDSGTNSAVDKPFIFVARDAATYQLLQSLSPNLPAASTIDFEQNAVVAAFAGTLPNPGYGIETSKTSNGVKFGISQPKAGMMYPQVLVSPYLVQTVAVDEEKTLSVAVSDKWQPSSQIFRITKGEIVTNGGFIALEKQIKLKGTIEVMRHNDLVTFFYNVDGEFEGQPRKMSETASGQINKSNVIFNKFDVGSLIENPRPAMRGNGTFDGKKFSLKLTQLPTNVADGFAGSGFLEAVK